MAAQKFLRFVAGKFTEVLGLQSSSGAGDAGAIVALGEDGRLNNNMMPTGIGAETKDVPASENLAAGDDVNLWNDAGTMRARKADATTDGKPSDGFVTASVTSGNTATVYMDGINTQKSGLTAGEDVFLQTTAGLVGHTPPSGNGNIQQRVGKALSATEVVYERSDPITIVTA